jgi:Na+/H+ antiporter NhaC
MSILMPIAVPLAANVQGADRPILLAAIGSVLAGAIFGDHCSPISDTTVLSSVASASDHIDHVRTQAPYAIVVAGASLLLGCIPVGLGLSPWIGLAAGCVALLILLRVIGRT